MCGVPHWPLALQISTELSFAHWEELGTQTPVHAPAEQTNGHGDPWFCHCPEDEHTCGWVPLHCTVPGVQAPQKLPLTQAGALPVQLTQAPPLLPQALLAVPPLQAPP
jgi:hypothetical protein